MSTAASRFPFSAVVGQDDVKLALLLAAVDPRIGGVLLRGEKGSAKTTLARGVAALLPGEAPFAELPLGASEDRLVGTLDLAAALAGEGVRFQPGLLAAAHGGVLYVDEVNLLADHLVDVLLDVATSGVNRVEREGISHVHPARLVLVGSMNPEEGELRPQLLDRFGLAVDVTAGRDPAARAEAVRRRLDFDDDAGGFAERWADEEAAVCRRLATASPAEVPHDLLMAISDLCASVGAEGLRADLVTARAAAALAGWEGRTVAGPDDVRRVAALTLAHRRRRSPFEEPGIADDELQRALDDALERPGDGNAPDADDGRASDRPDGARAGSGREPAAERPTTDPAGAGDGEPTGPGSTPPDADAPCLPDEAVTDGRSGEGRSGAPPRGGRPGASDGAGGGAAAGPGPARGPGAPGAGTWHVRAGEVRAVRRLEAPRAAGSGSGGRSTVVGKRGRTVAARRPDGAGAVGAVAVGATVAAAVTRRAADPVGPAVVRADVREAVRETTAGNLVVVAVDTSGSMGARRRMEVVSGALLGLLADAYQRRDRVAVVAFRGEGAEVVLRPTSSVEVARARLATVPTGGRTPLAAGIDAALRVARTGASPTHRPLIVLVSDGRATAGPEGVDPLEAALAAAGTVRRQQVPAVVVDAEDGPIRLGLAGLVATAMGAEHLSLDDLTTDTLRRVTG